MFRLIRDHDDARISYKVDRFLKECTAFGPPTQAMEDMLKEYEANAQGLTYQQSRISDQELANQKRSLTNAKKKSREAEKEIAAAAWARTFMKPGMIVRMKGTRDHGVRLVLSIDKYNTHCQQVQDGRNTEVGDNVFVYGKYRLVKVPRMTTHSHGKVMEYLNPETSNWEKVNTPARAEISV